MSKTAPTVGLTRLTPPATLISSATPPSVTPPRPIMPMTRGTRCSSVRITEGAASLPCCHPPGLVAGSCFSLMALLAMVRDPYVGESCCVVPGAEPNSGALADRRLGRGLLLDRLANRGAPPEELFLLAIDDLAEMVLQTAPAQVEPAD